jgi:hypothetical protein
MNTKASPPAETPRKHLVTDRNSSRLQYLSG